MFRDELESERGRLKTEGIGIGCAKSIIFSFESKLLTEIPVRDAELHLQIISYLTSMKSTEMAVG